MKTLLILILFLLTTPAYAVTVVDWGEVTTGVVGINTCSHDGFCTGVGSVSLSNALFTLSGTWVPFPFTTDPGWITSAGFNLVTDPPCPAGPCFWHGGSGVLNFAEQRGSIGDLNDDRLYTFTTGPWAGEIVVGTIFPVCANCPITTWKGERHIVASVATPEPATWLLMVGGLWVLWFLSGRKGWQ